MKKLLLLIILCIILSGCANRYDKRLEGTWKSNRNDTVAEFKQRFPNRFRLNEDSGREEKFAQLFGHMNHTFTDTDLTVEYKGNVFTVKYKVIELGKDFVIIRTSDEDLGDMKIRFVDNFDSYWTNEDSDFSEKFTKIKITKTLIHNRKVNPDCLIILLFCNNHSMFCFCSTRIKD